MTPSGSPDLLNLLFHLTQRRKLLNILSLAQKKESVIIYADDESEFVPSPNCAFLFNRSPLWTIPVALLRLSGTPESLLVELVGRVAQSCAGCDRVVSVDRIQRCLCAGPVHNDSSLLATCR